MEHPADDCQSLLGRQLIHARSGRDSGDHVVDLFRTSAGAVLVLNRCRPHSGMVRCRYNIRFFYDSAYHKWVLFYRWSSCPYSSYCVKIMANTSVERLDVYQ